MDNRYFSVEPTNHSGNTSHTNTTQSGPKDQPAAPGSSNDSDVFLQVTHLAIPQNLVEPPNVTNW